MAAALAMSERSSSHSASTTAAELHTTSGSSPQSAKVLVRTVNPGDRVNIPCSLANMGGSIQFARDDQPIILDSGCAHCQLDISNDGQPSLTINRVSQHDQGHWQCWRLDAQGKVKQKVPIMQLAVTNSPELPILFVNDKELLGGNNLDATITVKENEIVNFKCVIKGASTPVDYVHWILDSQTNVTHMSQLMMEYSAQENNYLTQSVLKLNATKSMNLKSISCLSNHQLWLTPMTVTALLNVLYEPSFTISREPGFGVLVSEGMSVILKCEIDSNPSSNPIWIKDAENKTASLSAASGTEVAQQQQFNGRETALVGEPTVLDTQEDGSVIFQPVKQSDSGWYRCKTENKYGNFSSFGYYLNVRPAASSGATSSNASPSTLSNYIGGGSAHSTSSNNNNQALGHQRPRSDSRIMSPNQPAAQVSGPSFLGHRQQQSPESFGPALQRAQLPNDQPAAVQEATDPARCKPSSVRGIDGSPEIKSPIVTVQAMLGRQLILPLRFCCNPGPARVFWIHRHLAMIPGRMFGPYITREVYPAYNSFYCYETTFEIESVKPEDIGTVYVFVSNEKGHAGGQIHIQLAKPTGLGAIAGQPNLEGSYGQGHLSGLNLGSARFPPLAGSNASSSSGAQVNCLMLIIALAVCCAPLALGPLAIQIGALQFEGHRNDDREPLRRAAITTATATPNSVTPPIHRRHHNQMITDLMNPDDNR